MSDFCDRREKVSKTPTDTSIRAFNTRLVTFSNQCWKSGVMLTGVSKSSRVFFPELNAQIYLHLLA